MLAAKALGADQSAVLKYANSGDVSGNREHVVGYLSAAFSRPTDG
jgi:AmmeMemoRadiSam system protein B